MPAIKLRILSSLRISFSCQLCILGLLTSQLTKKQKQTNKNHTNTVLKRCIYLFNLCTPCVIQLRQKMTCKKRIICLPPPHPPFKLLIPSSTSRQPLSTLVNTLKNTDKQPKIAKTNSHLQISPSSQVITDL